MNEQWLEKIRRQMEHYEAEAPEGLYNDILAEMERRGTLPVVSRQTKRRAAYLRMRRTVGAVASIAAVALIAMLVVHPSAEQPSPLASLPSQPVPEGHPSEVPSVEKTQEKGTGESWFARVKRLATNAPEYNAVPTELALAEETVKTEVTGPVQPDEVQEKYQETVEPVNEQPAQSKENKAKDEKKPWRPKSIYGDLNGQTNTYTEHKRGGGRLGMDTYVQGATTNKNGNAGVGPVHSYLSQHAPVYGDKDLPLASGKIPSTLQPGDVKTNHRLPVKTGVSLRYHINDKWSVQTGVSYSYHSSEIINGDETADQKLHFVGVPVAASYSVWNNDHFNVYVTAGGEVEKLVKGKRSIARADHRAEEKIKMSQLQVSATLAAGVEYMPTPSVGIFVEPGGSYHFDNGSGVSTVYNDTPLDFCLSFGVRINFNK